MTDLSINGFGSLTNKTGNQVKLDLKKIKEFDENGDSVIEKSELENYVKSLNEDFDATEINKLFNALDENASGDVDADELEKYEQKEKMQEAVNVIINEAAADANLSGHAVSVKDSLKSFMEDFIKSYTGEVADMATSFQQELSKKYSEIKTGIKENDPATIQDKVLDAFALSLKTTTDSTRNDGEAATAIPDSARTRLLKLLETEADKFRKNYTGTNFEADLKAHLEEYLSTPDSQKIKNSVDELDAKVNTYGEYISANELPAVKEDVAEFLRQAIESGVTIKLDGRNILTESTIKTTLATYSSGDELITAIKTAINNVNNVNLVDTVVQDEIKKAEEAAEKAFTEVKGESYQVNKDMLDYSKIPGYYENAHYSESKSGKDGAKDNAIELLNNTLKEQFKSQIETMLKAKGIPFDKVATVFERIFNESVQAAADECVDGQHSTFFRSSSSWFNTKDLCDNFIDKFNTNIAAAINELNQSNSDMDIVDIDYSKAFVNEDGTSVSEEYSPEALSAAFESGETLEASTSEKDSYDKMADNLINNMKSQMLMKAQNMCKANGVAFDADAFSTIFNNSSAKAKADSVDIDRILFSYHISINPQTLLKTFTKSFQESFTNWIDTQKKPETETESES